MSNLLEETIRILSENGKSESDVEWCGATGFGYFSWEEFKQLSDKIYDNGYGGQEVAPGLVIVGSDFWLERHEYDGAEWWEFKTHPAKPENKKIPITLFCNDLCEVTNDSI